MSLSDYRFQAQNLALRMYEHTALPPNVPTGFKSNGVSCLYIFRFIDDALILHSANFTCHLCTYLCSVYPPHLTFSFEHLGVRSRVPFMDLYIQSLYPLETCVFFKETNTASYLHWSSDTPRHVKAGWLHAEGVRALRLCSSAELFKCCVTRFTQAIIRLGYPKSLYTPFPVDWSMRQKYLQRSQHVTSDPVHVLKVPHCGSIPIRWNKLVKSLHYKCQSHISGLRTYVILQSAPSLRRMWSKHRHLTVSKAYGESLSDSDSCVDLLLDLQQL